MLGQFLFIHLHEYSLLLPSILTALTGIIYLLVLSQYQERSKLEELNEENGMDPTCAESPLF